MEHRVDLYNDFIKDQQLQKQQLEQEIERLNKNRDNLNYLQSKKVKM